MFFRNEYVQYPNLQVIIVQNKYFTTSPSGFGVRRDKAALYQWVRDPPG